MRELIRLSIILDKVPEKGEDADPVVQIYNDLSGLISVCDGLGGAGSTVYPDSEGANHTGAYYASRLVNRAVAAYFDRYKARGALLPPAQIERELHEQSTSELQTTARQLETSPSKLRSSLIKRLPTTLAALYFWPEAEDVPGQYRCCALWSGDSRAYVLNGVNGLQQLTRDDVKSAGDALEHLLNDSPLSNYINAESDFVLHHHVVSVRLPCIFLVATDGCFGYVPTPMHFEYALLKSLQDASEPKAWEDQLLAYFQRITGDDVSLALVVLGWEDFTACQRDLRARLDDLHIHYISPFDDVDQEFRRLTQRREELSRKRESLRTELWKKYKGRYETSVREEGR